MSGTNNKVGRYSESQEASFYAFDHLPPEVRQVIAAAPYKYHCGRQLKAFCLDGLSPRAFRRRFIERACEAIMRHARETYGPDHPDAQRSRLAGRSA